MNKINQLEKLLLTGKLLSKDIFKIEDIDLILDSRDEECFDDEWIRNYNSIKSIETKIVINSENEATIETICEISYKITYEATKSSDLAGYISDDFGLIAEALLIDYKDDWLNALASEYVRERVPHNVLDPLKGELDKIILID